MDMCQTDLCQKFKKSTKPWLKYLLQSQNENDVIKDDENNDEVLEVNNTAN